MSLLFVLLFVNELWSQKEGRFASLRMVVFSALMVLANPISIIVFFGGVILHRKRFRGTLFTSFLPSILCMFLWVYYSFDSLGGFVYYFFEFKLELTQILNLGIYDILLPLALMVFVVLGCRPVSWMKGNSEFWFYILVPLVVLSLGGALFSSLVLLMLFLAFGYETHSTKKTFGGVVVLISCLTIGMVNLLGISSNNVINQHTREFIRQNIPAGATVYGGKSFWYLFNEGNWDFVLFPYSWKKDGTIVNSENNSSESYAISTGDDVHFEKFSISVIDSLRLGDHDSPVYIKLLSLSPIRGQSVERQGELWILTNKITDPGLKRGAQVVNSFSELALRLKQRKDSSKLNVIITNGIYELDTTFYIGKLNYELRLEAETYGGVHLFGSKAVESANGVVDLGKNINKFRQVHTSCWIDDDISPAEFYFGGHRIKFNQYPKEGWGNWKQIKPVLQSWNPDREGKLSYFPRTDWEHRIIPISDTLIDFVERAYPGIQEKNQKIKLLNWPGDLSKNSIYIDFLKRKAFIKFDVNNKCRLSFSPISNLIQLDSARNVVISGLNLFETRGSGINLQHSSKIRVEDVCVKNCGGDGIKIDHSNAVEISDCIIQNTGRAGISVFGNENLLLHKSNVSIQGNDISKTGEYSLSYSPGIEVKANNVHVFKNEIHDIGNTGIILSGSENLVEFNEVKNVGWLITDVGGIYSYALNYCDVGNVIRGNYVHDLKSGRMQGATGIYIDGFSSGYLVEGNLCVNTGKGYLSNGGVGNELRGNTFVDCIPAIQIEAPAETYSADYVPQAMENVKLKDSIGWFVGYESHREFLQEIVTQPLGGIVANNCIYRPSWKRRIELGLFEGKERVLLRDLLGDHIRVGNEVVDSIISFTFNKVESNSNLKGFVFKDFSRLNPIKKAD